MKKVFCVLLLFGFLAAPDSGLAQQDTIKCCCTVECTYIKGGRVTYRNVYGCRLIYFLWGCDAQTLCEANKWGSWEVKEVTGSCTLSCPSETALGEDHQGLTLLRKFRDQQLAKTAVGNKLKTLYYDYASTLSEVFVENPSLGIHAKELLEKLIPRIKASLRGKLKGPVLEGELYGEAEMLLDEIDGVLNSPLKKDLMELMDEARAAGLVE